MALVYNGIVMVDHPVEDYYIAKNTLGYDGYEVWSTKRSAIPVRMTETPNGSYRVSMRSYGLCDQITYSQEELERFYKKGMEEEVKFELSIHRIKISNRKE